MLSIQGSYWVVVLTGLLTGLIGVALLFLSVWFRKWLGLSATQKNSSDSRLALSKYQVLSSRLHSLLSVSSGFIAFIVFTIPGLMAVRTIESGEVKWVISFLLIVGWIVLLHSLKRRAFDWDSSQ